MQAIDCHSHYVPAAIREAIQRSTDRQDVAGDLIDDELVVRFSGSAGSIVLPRELSDRDSMLRWMGSRGIAHQVVSGWTGLFGTALDPRQAQQWHYFMNDALRDEVDAQDAWSALASVSLLDGKLAAEGVLRAAAEGFVGVTVGAPAGPHEFDSDEIAPFWNAVNETRLPVLVHPMRPDDHRRLADYGLATGFGRLVESSIAVARLVLSGRLNDLPGVRVLVAHGGGTLPFVWKRIERNFEITTGMPPPSEVFQRALYFDSVVHGGVATAALLEFAGTQRIVIGSDHPFEVGMDDPVEEFDALATLAEADKLAICAHTAADLFGLSAVENATSATPSLEGARHD